MCAVAALKLKRPVMCSSSLPANDLLIQVGCFQPSQLHTSARCMQYHARHLAHCFLLLHAATAAFCCTQHTKCVGTTGYGHTTNICDGVRVRLCPVVDYCMLDQQQDVSCCCRLQRRDDCCKNSKTWDWYVAPSCAFTQAEVMCMTQLTTTLMPNLDGSSTLDA